MQGFLTQQGIYLLRILIAAGCGLLIGYERQNRLKNAGVRTHVIVSVASALMMIISKYGFYDIVGHNGIGLDPSRIAAGVVTAIGFLGAGVIFNHKQTVSGLTTAAGIWATVGIGMAVGAGMYLIGVVTAVLITVFQAILHKSRSLLKTPLLEKIVFCVSPENTHIPDYLKKLRQSDIEIISTKVERTKEGKIELRLYVRFPDTYRVEDLLKLLMEDATIQTVEM